MAAVVSMGEGWDEEEEEGALAATDELLPVATTGSATTAAGFVLPVAGAAVRLVRARERLRRRERLLLRLLLRRLPSLRDRILMIKLRLAN